MKNFFYSYFTKLVAAILVVATIVGAALVGFHATMVLLSEEDLIYNFTADISSSNYLKDIVSTPLRAVDIALWHYHSENKENDTIEQAVLSQYTSEALSDMAYLEELDYYIKIGSLTFSNCDLTGGQEFPISEWYNCYELAYDDDHLETNQSGSVDTYTYEYYDLIPPLQNISKNWKSLLPIVVYAGVKQERTASMLAVWERQEREALNALRVMLVLMAVALVLFMYLLVVCGKNKYGEYKGFLSDKLWLEVHIASVAFFGVGGFLLATRMIDQYFYNNLNEVLILTINGILLTVAASTTLSAILSITRNLKNGKLVSRSLIPRMLRWIFRKMKHVCHMIVQQLSKKAGFLLMAALLLYSVVIWFLGVFAPETELCILLSILLFVAALVVMFSRSREVRELSKGVERVYSGNFTEKIPNLKWSDLNAAAGQVNEISRGMDDSLTSKLRAERMKTELITNVSHDLKTPITSILNYSQLLTQMESLPEEATDYSGIIYRKALRLKNLTQDLFDISKAQSGNETVEQERLDVALLIDQAMGELDTELQKSKLCFCVNTEKNLFIRADGRKMSRVLNNLLGNAIKYTMPGTRVFVTACNRDGNAIVEFKNVASYPMEFAPEEIMGRFVRGDESRTTDGNGLGLAIVQSYTQLCGGSFRVVVDGDLFKAILTFPTV